MLLPMKKPLTSSHWSQNRRVTRRGKNSRFLFQMFLLVTVQLDFFLRVTFFAKSCGFILIKNCIKGK